METRRRKCIHQEEASISCWTLSDVWYSWSFQVSRRYCEPMTTWEGKEETAWRGKTSWVRMQGCSWILVEQRWWGNQNLVSTATHQSKILYDMHRPIEPFGWVAEDTRILVVACCLRRGFVVVGTCLYQGIQVARRLNWFYQRSHQRRPPNPSHSASCQPRRGSRGFLRGRRSRTTRIATRHSTERISIWYEDKSWRLTLISVRFWVSKRSMLWSKDEVTCWTSWLAETNSSCFWVYKR